MSTMSVAISLEDFLKIPASEPERIFARPDDLRGEYGVFLKTWLPAVNAGDKTASEAFQHLHTMYEEAKRRTAAGLWRTPGKRTLVDANGTAHEIAFRVSHPFELGEMLVGDDHVTYLVKPEFRDIYNEGRKAISHISFADDKMRAAIARSLPTNAQAYETKGDGIDGPRLVLSIAKDPQSVLLADVIAHERHDVDLRHVSWVISDLLNLGAWLGWARIGHNDISPATVFINPKEHTVALLGGWFYARPIGARLFALPARSVAALSRELKRNKTADPRIDLDLIRLVGREMMLDHRAGKGRKAPSAVSLWLDTPSAGDALADYKTWVESRKTLGPRVFTPYPLVADDLYPRRTITRRSA